jgi:hypothetical protein
MQRFTNTYVIETVQQYKDVTLIVVFQKMGFRSGFISTPKNHFLFQKKLNEIPRLYTHKYNFSYAGNMNWIDDKEINNKWFLGKNYYSRNKHWIDTDSLYKYFKIKQKKSDKSFATKEYVIKNLKKIYHTLFEKEEK